MIVWEVRDNWHKLKTRSVYFATKGAAEKRQLELQYEAWDDANDGYTDNGRVGRPPRRSEIYAFIQLEKIHIGSKCADVVQALNRAAMRR